MESLQHNSYDVEVVRRPYQRTIGVSVRPSGRIRVTVGRTTSLRSVFKFLRHHDDWIEKAQADFKELRERYPEKLYVQGEGFLFRGELHHLNFESVTKKRFSFSTTDSRLNCYVPQEKWTPHYELAPQPHCKAELIKFYKKQGREILSQRVDVFSQMMNLYPKKLSFRSQKTRWGSCGSDGSVSLNWRLIAAPPAVLDYVVIHELSHLQHQNHSQRFWSLVADYCPDHKSLRTWLRKHQYEFDFLAERSELWD